MKCKSIKAHFAMHQNIYINILIVGTLIIICDNNNN